MRCLQNKQWQSTSIYLTIINHHITLSCKNTVELPLLEPYESYLVFPPIHVLSVFILMSLNKTKFWKFYESLLKLGNKDYFRQNLLSFTMIQCDLFGLTGFYFRNRRNKIPPKHAINFLIILATFNLEFCLHHSFNKFCCCNQA